METAPALTVREDQLAVFGIKELVLKGFLEAEALKCEDPESRKVIGKFRSEAKSLRVKIEQSRLCQNRKVLATNNDAAKAINERLTGNITAYDAEIKPYDQIAKDKTEARAKAEAERLAGINAQMESLTKLCAFPLQCNETSGNIHFLIALIEQFEVGEEFQELEPQAEITKTVGLAAAKTALRNRIEWEGQQFDNERIRLENEAKTQELADQQAAIEAEKEKARAEAAKVAETARIEQEKTDAEAKTKRDKEEARIALDRKALEDEKARIEAIEKARVKAAITAERDAKTAEDNRVRMDALRLAELKKRELLAEYSGYAAELTRAWMSDIEEEAHEINDLDVELKNARAEELRPDKEKLTDFAKKLSKIELPDLQTDAANEIGMEIFSKIQDLAAVVLAEIEDL